MAPDVRFKTTFKFQISERLDRKNMLFLKT
jgi:hypothetical protein